MKKALLALMLGCSIAVSAQTTETKPTENQEGFQFTTIKEVPVTPIKDQHRSSTCWSFSSVGLLEAEVLRLTGKEVDLAEMFIVSHTMQERARLFVRLHGNATFAPGGAFSDALSVMENHGLVPQDAMPGIMYGEELPVHNELDAVAKAYVHAIAKGKFNKLTPV